MKWNLSLKEESNSMNETKNTEVSERSPSNRSTSSIIPCSLHFREEKSIPLG